MNWKSYEIELITPCFCAGADQQKAEIRIPSIRGQIRWWFRALGGNAIEETALFGSVHGNTISSSLTFRLPNPPRSDKAVNLENLSFKNDYLFWPLRPTKQSQQLRGVLMPPVSFSLLMTVQRQGIRSGLLEKADAAIQLWILLGAIGTRCRRGAGSLWPSGETLSDEQALRKTISGLLGKFGKPGVQVFTLNATVKTAEEALRNLGNWLKQWRAGSTSSVSNPQKWGLNDHNAGLGKTKTVFRPVLGLPLTQRYQDGFSVETQYDKAEGRWASPLHLKVIRLGQTYAPLAVYFPEHAIPEGSELQIGALKGRERPYPVTLSHDLINQMLHDLEPVWPKG